MFSIVCRRKMRTCCWVSKQNVKHISGKMQWSSLLGHIGAVRQSVHQNRWWRTAFARNSGCTKRKLHLHGCLPTPCPQFRAGRGICIEFGVACHHNTPPIAGQNLQILKGTLPTQRAPKGDRPVAAPIQTQMALITWS